MISEPMTLATDYLLALVSAVAGVMVLRRSGAQHCRPFWGIAFLALAFAAALGGTHHGFEIEALWKPTVLAVGIASFAMLSGSAYATTHGAVRRALIAFALVELALFTFWMTGHHEFIWVIVDTGIAMLLVALLHAIRWRDAGSRWILAGVGTSFVAAGVQASGFALHRHFNHNDLYHVVQIVAMLLYYRGVVQLQDRGMVMLRPRHGGGSE